VVRPPLVSALQAQGTHGQRALNLLLDAACILNDPAAFHAPYELAQSCLRGALDSVLKIAGEDFPGLRSATEAVTEAAGAVADTWQHRQETEARGLDALARTVEKLRAEQAERGGFRTRQIGHLVAEQTRQEMGLAETEAARRWSAFYSSASGVLHGASLGADEARHQFGDVTAAMEQLFLSLPERAKRLRELARLENPVQQDADEVERMTDPRAGMYFFQAAVSRRWLDLLPMSRLLPEQARWPAGPYLRRLGAKEPQRVCGWVEENLEAICSQGPGALSQAVVVLGDAGMAAAAVLADLVRSRPEESVLVQAAYWAVGVPVAERTGRWVSVVENILIDQSFTTREFWESGQLLRELIATAHPGDRLRTYPDRLAGIIRSALAGVLAGHLGAPGASLRAELVNELGTVTLADSPHAIVVALMRAVLDLALAEARLGVPVVQRLRGVHGKLSASEHRARLAATHLTESWPHDSQHDQASADWWHTAIETARRAGGGRRPNADLADFLALLDDRCPPELRQQMEAALTETLSTPPDAVEIRAWADAFPGPLPSPWRIVRGLSPVLPATVRAPWQPVLALLEEKYGPPPGRPNPVMKTTSWVEAYGGLSLEVFTAQAGAEGTTATVAALAAAPVTDEDYGDEDRAGLLRELVAQDPQTWAADPAVIAAAAARPALQAAYFNALHYAAGSGRLDPGALVPVAEAAFAVRPQAGDGPEAEQLQLVISNLLHHAWNKGVSLRSVEADAVTWLRGLVTSWSTPRVDTPSPLATAVEAPGAGALLYLIAWGLHHVVQTGEGLPEPLTTTLEEILGAESDDQALAVIGFCLAQLHRRAPAWTTARADTLLSLDHAWRPARVWLTHGRPDTALLARLERTGVWHALCVSGDEDSLGNLFLKVFLALLDDSEPLGPAGQFLAGLAGCPGGTEAVSEMLSRLAAYTAHMASSEVAARAAALWRAALEARLTPVALRGAGHFAFADILDQDTWLELTAATLTQQPDLEDAYRIAERATRSPHSPAAQLIAAAALDHGPLDGYQRTRTVRHAAALYAGSPTQDTPERVVLRTALINAGAIDDAYRN
jgi:hypothetical protein